VGFKTPAGQAVANHATQDREAQDRELCKRWLPGVSRTFALSIEGLPATLRRAVRVSYLLCRVVDTVEDGEQVDLRCRLALFELFDDLLQHDDRDPDPFELLCRDAMEQVVPAERELCVGAGAVFREFRRLPPKQRTVICPSVQEMSSGMREYVERAGDGGLQLSSMEDLERYCYFVAGTVGNLLTGLFLQQVDRCAEETRAAIAERAISFGLGLQMVNIVKDVAADMARGNHCFLPRQLVQRSGLGPKGLLDPTQREPALQVIRQVCVRAREHLVRAQEYTELWPVPDGLAVREFCAVPLALALATLQQVERGNDTLVQGRTPKVSREQVAELVADARQAVASNDALTRLFDRHRPAQVAPHSS